MANKLLVKGHEWPLRSKFTLTNQLLGEGSFGRAILAYDRVTGKEWVVKEVPVSRDAQEQEMLYNEVTIHMRLKHPYIVGVRDWTVDRREKILWMVLQYAPGGSLRDIVLTLDQLGLHLDEHVCRTIFVQLLLAVEYLHHNKILHRDIKTENILLACDPEAGPIEHVLLADFGVSKAVDPRSVMAGKTALATTKTGTPLYMAPEQHRHQPYSSKADIWALGCVLCEMMANKYAWEAHSLEDLHAKYERGAYSQPPSGYSGFLRKTVAAMLHPDPEKRPRARDLLVHPELQKNTAEALVRLTTAADTDPLAAEAITEQVERLIGASRPLNSQFASGRAGADIQIKGITPGATGAGGPRAWPLPQAADRCSVM